jgi:hypothetical protein
MSASEHGILGWDAIHDRYCYGVNRRGDLVQLISQRTLRSWRDEMLEVGAITKLPGRPGCPPRIVGWPERVETFVKAKLGAHD